MQQSGKSSCFSTKNISRNIVYAGCENQKRKYAYTLQELNSINSNIFETKNEYIERVIDSQKRHQE